MVLRVTKTGRPRRAHPEADLQRAFVQWRDLEREKIPELWLLFHVPNGEKRDPRTAAILRAMGVMSGVSDFIMLVPRGLYHGFTLELKAPGKSLSESQSDFTQRAFSQMYCINTTDSLATAISLTMEYLRLPAPTGVCQFLMDVHKSIAAREAEKLPKKFRFNRRRR